MTGTRRNQRVDSFGRVVRDYERGRPGYPEEAVSWMVGNAHRVIDLGAGTGKLTSSLVEPDREVGALEPQEQMVRRLKATVDRACAICATAEAVPIRSEWADVVVVAQAFHWFDQKRALPEIARVLRPEGRLALVWNVRDESVGWVAALSNMSGRENSAETRAALDETTYFGPFEALRVHMVQALDRDTLAAHVRSRSSVASLPEGERAEVMKSVVRLCDTHPDLAGKDLIELPYVTEAYRAERK